MNSISPGLKNLRSSKEVIKAGLLVQHGDIDFAVVRCEPPEGILTMDTEYFLEGQPLIRFEKIQFSAWGPVEMTSTELFSDVVAKHFQGNLNAPSGAHTGDP